jgi:hypothetical protein
MVVIGNRSGRNRGKVGISIKIFDHKTKRAKSMTIHDIDFSDACDKIRDTFTALELLNNPKSKEVELRWQKKRLN